MHSDGYGFKSERIFRVWDWLVSHSQLLIRSPRNEQDASDPNIDLTFSGVSYVETGDICRGLEIAEPTSDELAQLVSKCDGETALRFYVLKTAGKRYFVGAVNLTIEENYLAPMQTSLAGPHLK